MMTRQRLLELKRAARRKTTAMELNIGEMHALLDYALGTEQRKLCEQCHRPRDNDHPTLCPICLMKEDEETEEAFMRRVVDIYTSEICRPE